MQNADIGKHQDTLHYFAFEACVGVASQIVQIPHTSNRTIYCSEDVSEGFKTKFASVRTILSTRPQTPERYVVTSSLNEAIVSNRCRATTFVSVLLVSLFFGRENIKLQRCAT
jgi:hypothetical protein